MLDLLHPSRVLAASPPPVISNYSPLPEADKLLNLLAWCSSAAGVAGLLLVGMNLALQFRRGEPGEGATYYRHGVIVVMACIIASAAGPIVEFAGPFNI
ncbi:hypothetical protein Val02_50730 [Virgisporangium aliadipatigenens]|uniref:Uncharacterized protein n=1 Tax=Virgisporangium aliadipatigenens TaxID=741659 RepID=A0A8J3YPP5_9ACTN|nr:hypothetical protein [Virgisporangium aliadipatigenens]GIJ48187.1 hypothetical protein Val02_50730 [Virgisporangium aliadipatigenens]